MERATSRGLANLALPRSIAYSNWQAHIEMAPDLDQLMYVMRAYLAQWTPEDLRELPLDLGVTALSSSDELLDRAVIANRADLELTKVGWRNPQLAEIALAYASAAVRRGQLVALRGP
jgi:hypothetical protein